MSRQEISSFSPASDDLALDPPKIRKKRRKKEGKVRKIERKHTIGHWTESSTPPAAGGEAEGLLVPLQGLLRIEGSSQPASHFSSIAY